MRRIKNRFIHEKAEISRYCQRYTLFFGKQYKYLIKPMLIQILLLFRAMLRWSTPNPFLQSDTLLHSPPDWQWDSKVEGLRVPTFQSSRTSKGMRRVVPSIDVRWWKCAGKADSRGVELSDLYFSFGLIPWWVLWTNIKAPSCSLEAKATKRNQARPGDVHKRREALHIEDQLRPSWEI